MIRYARESDIERLCEMGAAFWDRSPWAAAGPFDAEKAANGFRQFIASPDMALFVIDRDGRGVCGALSIIISDLWTVAGGVMAQEGFWWVEPNASGEAMALWNAGEAFARERGAQVLAMVRLEGMRDRALDRLYRSRGYEAREHLYTRAL